jgi:hypothetical protein
MNDLPPSFFQLSFYIDADHFTIWCSFVVESLAMDEPGEMGLPLRGSIIKEAVHPANAAGVRWGSRYENRDGADRAKNLSGLRT